MTSSTWNELRIKKQLCDGEIKTLDGGQFPIHRVILSAFSPYFRAYFTNSLNNGSPEYTDMVIPDFSSDIVGKIIEFAYTQSCDVTSENVHTLMVAADRFSCDPLVQFCSEYISCSLTASNCFSNLRFARSFFFRDLKVKTWQYACDNAEQVMVSSEFKNLTADELTELLSADELNIKQEELVFQALFRWVLEDIDSRRRDIPQLLECVRFGLVSFDYYEHLNKNFDCITEECQDLLRTVQAYLENNHSSCQCRPRVPNEVVFTFGGWTEGSPIDVIETFDKRTGCWYIPNIKSPTIRAYHGVILLNKLIYVIGGFDGGTKYFSTMHCFDPISYTWTEKACMHDVRCYVSVCELDGDIFAIGGFNGRSRLSSAERYNPATNQWTTIASLNRRRSDGSAASLNQKVYVAGGFDGHEVMRSVEVYSPLTDQWDFVDYMSTPRSGVSLIAHGQYIYALGGFNGENRLYSGERFNPLHNRWNPIADMLFPRSNMASVIIDNRIFVIGGFNGTTTIPCTEFYIEEDNAWYKSARLNIKRSALSACVCHGLPNARSYTFLGMTKDHSSDGDSIKK